MKEIIKSAIATPSLLQEIYVDLAKPGVSQVGKSIGTLLGYANTKLGTLEERNEIAKIALTRNLESYRSRMVNVPEERVIQASAELAVPILEKLTYVTNAEIRNLYVELLAKASDSQTVEKAHPSFVNMISALSPDEAVLISMLPKQGGIPYVEGRLITTEDGAYRVVVDLVTSIVGSDQLTYQNLMSTYMSNFEGLGIIKISGGSALKDDKQYIPLENKVRSMHPVKANDRNVPRIECSRGIIKLTPFGQLFVVACTVDA